MKLRFNLLLFCLFATCSAYAAPTDAQYAGVLNLVKAGKIAEAKIKVETYLEIWPEEAQLLAMAESLKNHAESQPVLDNTLPDEAEPQEVASSTGTISSLDRLEVETVLQMALDVSKMESEVVRKESAVKVLSRAVPDAAAKSTDPHWFRFWLARVAMALEAENIRDGVEASIQLKRLGIIDSEDPFARKMLVRLNRVGWLNRELPEIPEFGMKKTVYLDSGQKLEMIWVEPRSFFMGSNDGYASEKPVRRVTLSSGFWLGKTEVTQQQWRAVMRNNPSEDEGDQLPIVNVSFQDAMEFCRKLNVLVKVSAEGQSIDVGDFTLPTEAQWEYACRAGTVDDHSGYLEEMAWYSENSGMTLHKVGQKLPNAWGFYDMHGNVNEMVQDIYGPYPSGTALDPTGVNEGDMIVIRGGSTIDNPDYCRSAFRMPSPKNNALPILGFRLALIP